MTQGVWDYFKILLLLEVSVFQAESLQRLANHDWHSARLEESHNSYSLSNKGTVNSQLLSMEPTLSRTQIYSAIPETRNFWFSSSSSIVFFFFSLSLQITVSSVLRGGGGRLERNRSVSLYHATLATWELCFSNASFPHSFTLELKAESEAEAIVLRWVVGRTQRGQQVPTRPCSPSQPR